MRARARGSARAQARASARPSAAMASLRSVGTGRELAETLADPAQSGTQALRADVRHGLPASYGTAIRRSLDGSSQASITPGAEVLIAVDRGQLRSMRPACVTATEATVAATHTKSERAMYLHTFPQVRAMFCRRKRGDMEQRQNRRPTVPWRRRRGIEPPCDGTRRTTVLKTAPVTRPDTPPCGHLRR